MEALKLIKSVLKFSLIVRATHKEGKVNGDSADEDCMKLELVEATPDQMTLVVLTIEELEYQQSIEKTFER